MRKARVLGVRSLAVWVGGRACNARMMNRKGGGLLHEGTERTEGLEPTKDESFGRKMLAEKWGGGGPEDGMKGKFYRRELRERRREGMNENDGKNGTSETPGTHGSDARDPTSHTNRTNQMRRTHGEGWSGGAGCSAS
jgi:hypothetical protein